MLADDEQRSEAEILYEAICAIAAVPEWPPNDATKSWIDLQWGAMVRGAQNAKKRVDEKRAFSQLPISRTDDEKALVVMSPASAGIVGGI